MLKFEEIKKTDGKTLQKSLVDLRRELFELKIEKYMKKQAGGLKKSHELKTKRRVIARILTALHSSKVGEKNART